jgi:hypothetical protein
MVGHGFGMAVGMGLMLLGWVVLVALVVTGVVLLWRQAGR